MIFRHFKPQQDVSHNINVTVGLNFEMLMESTFRKRINLLFVEIIDETEVKLIAV